MNKADQNNPLTVHHSADGEYEISCHISKNIRESYDVYSYRHAAAILNTSFSEELLDIEQALREFKITTIDITKPGGNESDIPKQFSVSLRPKQWYETRIQGDLIVRVFEQTSLKNSKSEERSPITLKNYIDGHKIDYIKGRVALDVEWNSKDQTYDRDLYAFRTFHECGIISVAILITRSEKLNQVFETLPLLKRDGSVDRKADGTPKLSKQKYGASTTWMGKLLYRLNAGRHGGCPVLVFGITPKVISDWSLNSEDQS